MLEHLLLLPEGWPRVLALVVAAGILALSWGRRGLLEAFHQEQSVATPPVHEEQDSIEAAPQAAAASATPLRSLVLVARNEACRLPALCGDLERLLDEDDGLELLLADDASTDGTRLLMEAFVERVGPHRARLQPVDAGCRGKPAWLRHLVPLCQGRVVLFTDADCRLPRGWSRAMETLLELRGPQPWAAAGGLVLLEACADPDWIQRWQRLHWILLSSTGAALGQRQGGLAPSLWGANLVFHQPTLEVLGGYASLASVDAGEDLHLVRSLRQRGALVRLAALPRATRVRTAPVDAPGLVRQLARWGASLFSLGAREVALVLGVLAWLLALALVLCIKPALGLLLTGVALLPLHALLDALADALGEEKAGFGGAALYLGAGILLLPAALLQGLWMGLRGDRHWRRPA